MTSPLIPDKGPDTSRYIDEVRERAPTIADVMQAAVDHKTRAELQGEIVSLRHTLECIIVNEHHMTTSQMADLARGALKDKQP